jgi:hypothetical protein
MRTKLTAIAPIEPRHRFPRYDETRIDTKRAPTDPGEVTKGGAMERRIRSSAADTLTRAGTSTRFEDAIHLPGDELCFFIFEAPSGRAAALAARRAELDPLRVVEAVSSTNEQEEK